MSKPPAADTSQTLVARLSESSVFVTRFPAAYLVVGREGVFVLSLS